MSRTRAATRGFTLGAASTAAVFVDETPGGQAAVQARASIREATHPDGHALELAYLVAPNGER